MTHQRMHILTLNLKISEVSVMRAKCISNEGDYSPLVVPVDPSQPMYEDNYTWSTIPTVKRDNVTEYRVTKNGIYVVYAVVVYADQIWYLICDDDNVPSLLPSDLFVLADSEVAIDWIMKPYKIYDQLLFLLGYLELVNDYNAFINLINLKPLAISAFLKYKEHYNQYYI